ncbi:hypothetical protein BJF83_21355 [Nocardiopsis sp. CNR-923]|uniref:hypothetical protein n=1 Tax=Nocardiopsis sp. CNR-923 TaxID=1904965 RepID=UPI0009676A97|nr:hypothetical protein [Nocardiopsis sp. CNR-923]OLT26350.1 hypothetical protein BJF83_21355 [Nocardiopsis sp. CNR-923]
MKIPPEVLEVLVNDQVSTDGPLLRLPMRLDRALYEKVNRVLMAAGGRWDGSKGARGHRFDRPAAQVLAQLRTGEYTTAKEQGFVPAPPTVAAELLSCVTLIPGARVLEPSAGDGALVRVIAATGVDVEIDMVENNVERAQELRALVTDGTARSLYQADFLGLVPPDPQSLFDLPGCTELYDLVVMNPPFDAQARHVLHAWKWLKPGGQLAAIVSAGLTFREDRIHGDLRALIEECGTILRGRVPDTAFAPSRVAHVTTVIVTLRKSQA